MLRNPVVEVDQGDSLGRENRLLVCVDRVHHHRRFVDVEAVDASGLGGG
jgi:hypothetical protein